MKNKIVIIIIDGIALLIFSLLSFTYVNTTFPAFTVSYIFLSLAIIVQLVPVFLSDTKKDTAYKSLLFTVSFLYLAMQAALSILGYTLLRKSRTTIIVFSIILLCVYIAVMLGANTITDNGEYRRKAEKEKAVFIDKTVCKLEICKTGVVDNELSNLLNENIDELKFSDIMSPENASEVEVEIIESVRQIEKLINGNLINEAKNECRQLGRLIQERKNICKLYK
ncbi:MAG: hypothetical protein ACI4I9_06850 [Porcipelethomonas sp.]